MTKTWVVSDSLASRRANAQWRRIGYYLLTNAVVWALMSALATAAVLVRFDWWWLTITVPLTAFWVLSVYCAIDSLWLCDEDAG